MYKTCIQIEIALAQVSYITVLMAKRKHEINS